MKIKGEKYEIMNDAIEKFVDHHSKEKVKLFLHNAHLQKGAIRGAIWRIWHEVEKNLLFSDEHPAFKNGTWIRIIPYNTNFKTYSNEDCDSHLETALKKILKDLGVFPNRKSPK